MPILDEFNENYFLLLEIAYSPERREFPVIVARKKKTSGGGIHCRNGDALRTLRNVERRLRRINSDILRFFEVDEAVIVGNGRKRR